MRPQPLHKPVDSNRVPGPSLAGADVPEGSSVVNIKSESAVPLSNVAARNLDSENYAPDKRRQMAQRAAKSRWATWAAKKVR